MCRMGSETVYGLGANALDEAAVVSIFEFKGRPFHDPLIVHVPTYEAARELLVLDEGCSRLLDTLARQFWPGPLTIVGPAAPCIPSKVTANTGQVGVRVPAYPLARALLVEARVPVAAPSANRFGHVSPTTSAHVLDDLGDHPIAILEDTTEESAVGRVGIESTVVGLEAGGMVLAVLRLGGVPLDRLRAAVESEGVRVETRGRAARALTEALSTTGDDDEDTSAMTAPGQLLTHYAPDVPAALVARVSITTVTTTGSAMVVPLGESPGESCPLRDCVVVDCAGHLRRQLGDTLTPLDLRDLTDVDSEPSAASSSSSSDPEAAVRAAARAVFATLRWAESVAGARRVLLCDPLQVPGVRESEGVGALRDRLYRAASGRFVTIQL